MRFLLACACAASIVAAAQDATVLDEISRAAKEPPKLTRAASAPAVLAACREMLPYRPIELKGAQRVGVREDFAPRQRAADDPARVQWDGPVHRVAA